MGESEPLFGGTMEDILLWRIASRSISRWRGAAAGGEGSRAAGGRNGGLTPPRASVRLRLCLQLNQLGSSLADPPVKWRVPC